MRESRLELAGIQTRLIEPEGPTRLNVVLLHGYAMDDADLAPFAHSLNLPARFAVPRGPHAAAPTGRAWWPIDTEARAAALEAGPRDLAQEHPSGLAAARNSMVRFIEALAARHPDSRLVLGGFSQGGMLACDVALHFREAVSALVLLSASRLNIRGWQEQGDRLRGLPAFVSHGERDDDLAFAAGERLRDFLLACGAQVEWTRFDGGHEIPLPVWRSLRKFLAASL